MRRVYLLRHAKSSWKDRSLADRDRPLAGRGKRAAKAVAGHIEAEGIRPDLVLCSPARRTRETFERVEAALGDGVEAQFEDALYGASEADLFASVRGWKRSTRPRRSPRSTCPQTIGTRSHGVAASWSPTSGHVTWTEALRAT